MKKQFLFIAVITTSAIFFSCSKEKIETAPMNESLESISKPVFKLDPLSVGLLGRYEFNNTLKDTTGKLADFTSTVGRVLYTTDRKGVANRAIRFNQAYGLFVKNVPLDTNMSVSIWVKNDIYPVGLMVPLMEGSQAISFWQLTNTYKAFNWNTVAYQGVTSGPIDNNWHHLAATRDAISLKFYIDGNLVGTSPTPAGTGPNNVVSDYTIGYGYNAGYKYWKGNMDDFRIYKRVLSAAEVNTLANL
jgi:hypothetical protein